MTSASAPLLPEAFAGNRAVGKVALAVDDAAGMTRRTHVHEAGSLRVRFPNAERPAEGKAALDAVLVNTAGGVTGGDRFEIDLKVGAGARLAVTTAAAEKIYRSLGPDSRITVNLQVATQGDLIWLPQETILFDRARLQRSIEVDLASGARLLLVEAIVFGRAAMGETVLQGRLLDRWRIRVDGAPVFAETVRLDGKIAECLARPACAAGAAAIASVVKIPGGEDDIAAVRAGGGDFCGEVGISAWNGLAATRLVASNGADLRRDLIAVLTALRSTPLPRLWFN